MVNFDQCKTVEVSRDLGSVVDARGKSGIDSVRSSPELTKKRSCKNRIVKLENEFA